MVEPPSTKWRLIHNGLHLDGSVDRSAYFEIPGLHAATRPVYGSPDLIYQHSETGAAVIVEIKFTRKTIPTNLWPNVWAQLWAYSKIPLLKDSKSVDLVGEVWGRNDSRSTRLTEELYLRSVVRRPASVPAFERFFYTLYGIYVQAATSEA
jgi:hypothetical protein